MGPGNRKTDSQVRAVNDLNSLIQDLKLIHNKYENNRHDYLPSGHYNKCPVQKNLLIVEELIKQIENDIEKVQAL